MVLCISIIALVIVGIILILVTIRDSKRSDILIEAIIAEQKRQVIIEEQAVKNSRIEKGVHFDNGWIQLQPDNSYPYLNKKDITQINKLYEAKF